jgi:hypothetical protein
MKTVIILLLVLSVVAFSEGFKRHAVTVSAGIPGLIIPELAYEYSFDAGNKISIAGGFILLAPEFRLSYTRMLSSFELSGSVGQVTSFDGNGGVFEEILSGGTQGTTFVSGTGGYRYTADGGFIFRVAGGGGYFFGKDKSGFIPFFQLGIGYGF